MNIVVAKINDWFVKYKPYFFSYSNGFFRLFYIANSPELIIESNIKFPFVKHDAERQLTYCDNSFVKSRIGYAELEKGLWCINSHIYFKNNLSFTPIYDESETSNYYCLIINEVKNEYPSKYYKINDIVVKNYSLSFLKPKIKFENLHFKGATENLYQIYFDRAWYEKNITTIPNLPKSVLELFENKNVEFINYAINIQDFRSIYSEFYNAFNSDSKPNHISLKKTTYAFFELFIENYQHNLIYKTTILKSKDRILLKKVEDYLLDNLLEKFIGIEQIADIFKVSPTKLKKDFKALYGTTIYGYFKEKQMKLALQILNKQNCKIKDLATMFHYENYSKFSKAFLNTNGFLPSENPKKLKNVF